MKLLGQKKERRFKIAALAVAVVLALLVMELGQRVYYRVHNAREPNHAVLDDAWGWKAAPDLRMSSTRPGYGRIDYSSDSDGFRIHGDLLTGKTKILVLGDSFTQGAHVSDGTTYFDHLQEHHPDIEIFAYGVEGYGTLQELLALEHYKERIKPDLILWQFCVNDFVANDHELESISRDNNNHMRRPYFEEGRVVYRHPDGYTGLITEYSYLARRLNIIFDSALKRVYGSVETELSFEHPVFRRSLETTLTLMRRAVKTAGVPLIVFNAAPLEGAEFEAAAFERLCAIEGLYCLPDLRPVLIAAQQAGQRINGGPGDSHWNEAGHTLVGEAILRYLVEHGFVGMPSQEMSSNR